MLRFCLRYPVSLMKLRHGLGLLCLWALAACGAEGGEGSTDAGGAPTDRIVWFVDVLAEQGGDGSASAPFAELGDAVQAALAGVADSAEFQLAAGTYNFPSDVVWDTRPLSFAGAGIDDTSLRLADGFGPQAEVRARALAIAGASEVLTVGGAAWFLDNVAVRELRLAFEAGAVELLGLRVEAGGVTVRGGTAVGRQLNFDDAFLRMESVTDADIETARFSEGEGPLLQLTDVTGAVVDLVVEDAGTSRGVELEGGDSAGQGVLVEGGSIAADDWTVVRSRSRGVNVRGGELSGSKVVVVGGGLTGLAAQQGASVELSDARVEAANVGVFASGASLTLRDTYVTECGNGCVLVSDGASLTLTDSTLEDCPSGHVSSLGEATTVDARGNTIVEAELESCVALSGTGGNTLSGNEIRGCAGTGVAISNAPAVVSDNQIRDIRESLLVPGVQEGISVIRANPTITGNVIEGFDGVGIALLNAGGTVEGNTLSDLGDAGIRAVERGDAPVIVRENVVTRASGVGIVALTVDATIEGNIVTETRYIAADQSGEGIAAGIEAEVEIIDNTSASNERAGLFLLAPVTARVEGNELRDNGTYGARCAGGAVELGANTFADNEAGDVEGCE